MIHPTNSVVEYLYEYMGKNIIPVTQIPLTFNTVITSLNDRCNFKEYVLPYDRDGIKNVAATLLQLGYINELNHYNNAEHNLIHERKELVSLLKKEYPLTTIRERYSFFNDSFLLLVEFYDFLRQVEDDFITTIIIKINTAGTHLIGFKIKINSITLLNSDGLLGLELINEARTRWNTICMNSGYMNHLGYLLNGETTDQMIFCCYYHLGD